jgi:hypothetical protein
MEVAGSSETSVNYLAVNRTQRGCCESCWNVTRAVQGTLCSLSYWQCREARNAGSNLTELLYYPVLQTVQKLNMFDFVKFW